MMNPFSKPFAALATASEDKLFLKARLKLSALYALFVLIILAALSGLLYYELVINITDSFGDQLSAGSPQEHALMETLEKLRMNIVITDAVIIVIVAALSYFFAAYTLRPIKRSMDAQKRFASDASHELRTPLTVMKTELEVAMCSKTIDEKDIRQIVRSTLEEVEHMSQLTEQLLFLSRIETEPTSAFTRLDLSALIKRVTTKMNILAQEKKLDLVCDVQKDCWILGNNHELERVLYNLMQNAINYTDKGSIYVDLERTGTMIILSVRDTGIGISSEHLVHIFDRFYKVDPARDMKKGGAGLGLAIVCEIIQRHRGRIEAQSTIGKGTTFTVSFPAI